MVVLETIIAKDIKTLVHKKFTVADDENQEEKNTDRQDNILSFIKFTGETLLESDTNGASQDFDRDWEVFTADFPESTFLTLPVQSRQIPLHHIFAQSPSGQELIKLTGGGAYSIDQSHLNGIINARQITTDTSTERPALQVQNSLLEGKLTLDGAYTEIAKSLYDQLDLELNNDASFIADQFMQNNFSHVKKYFHICTVKEFLLIYST